MRYETDFLRGMLLVFLCWGPLAMASNLTVTSYTDVATQDFQNDDTLQLGLAQMGIVAEHFRTSPPGMNPGPLAFGTSTADAVGFGDPGGTLGTHDYYPTGIIYSHNINSRWWNGNVLKDVTIFVLPTADERRYYHFEVQYTLNDGTGVYYDAVTNQPVSEQNPGTVIADSSMPAGTGTRIEITDINVANVSQVWIWTIPADKDFGVGKFSTTIAEIDVNFENCDSYPKEDINADCTINIADLQYLAEDWLLN